MSEGWELVINQISVDTFLACRPAERTQLLNYLQALLVNPYQKGDFIEKAPSGRDYQVKALGRFTVTFWADHAVKELRIVRSRKTKSP